MSKTWILVGDGSHARLFEVTNAATPWALVRRVDRAHSREKTNRADSHEDRGEHNFARELVAQLETARQADAFDKLVLVAPPTFLGQLRTELTPSLATCVTNSVDSDYTRIADGDLAAHVKLA